MKCPTCGRTTRVVDSRAGENNTRVRRRECTSGHRCVTVEILASDGGQAVQIHGTPCVLKTGGSFEPVRH